MKWINNIINSICQSIVDERYTKQDKYIDNLLKSYESIGERNKRLLVQMARTEKYVKELEAINHTALHKLSKINELIKVGVDVHLQPINAKSWAVICIKDGKHEQISFYNLNNTLREIKEFTGWFERNNVITDANVMAKQFLFGEHKL